MTRTSPASPFLRRAAFGCAAALALLGWLQGTASAAPAEPGVASSPGAAATASQPAARDGAAFRVDVGTGLVAATSSRKGLFGGEAYWLAGGPTLHVDLGAQLTQSWATFVRAEAGTILLSSTAAAYAMAEWKPHPRWSIATGLGAESFATMPIVAGGSWIGPSVPVVIGVDVIHRPENALRIELEQTGGFDKSGTAGWHSALTCKWVWN